MSVATPPRPPLADPDWAAWEAELAEPFQPQLADGGPPTPPDEPTDEFHGDGGDDGLPQRRTPIDFTWLKVLLGAFALMVVITLVSTQQSERHVPINTEPVSVRELYQSKTAYKAGPRPDRLQVMMNVPPSTGQPRR